MLMTKIDKNIEYLYVLKLHVKIVKRLRGW